MVYCNTVYNKITYNYFFKAFYSKKNKKRYKSQIWQHKIYYTNIIIQKNIIILKKDKKNKNLSKNIANTIVPAKLT